MSSLVPKYEVEVLVKDDPEHVKGYYSIKLGMYRNWEERKMKHIDARTPAEAAKKARKYGKVLSVRKHDPTRRFEQIEHIDFETTQPENIYKNGNPYSDAIAMDEMIWKKRNIRRNNMHRDKSKYIDKRIDKR